MRQKRKKCRKQRSHTTHGYGSMKKNRGAGNRGGRGMAGTGKRADTKKPSIINKYGNKYFGKHGFTSVKKVLHKIKVINLSLLQQKIESFPKQNGYIEINLKELGYDKLLGSGNITGKVKIIVDSASKKAIDKVSKAGGEIILSNAKPKEEVKEQ